MRVWHCAAVDDDVVKAHLHQKLRAAREALLWKLDGLSEYDIRRPMTPTGTNLLGLVKHNAISDARYFGEVFDRPFPEPLPRWDDPETLGAEHWATEQESREDVVGLYRRVGAHVDATIDVLPLDALGYVPWWDEEVPLLNVMAARLVDAVRHAGHADILRELVDGTVGLDAGAWPLHGRDEAHWAAHRARLEAAARAAGGAEPT